MATTGCAGPPGAADGAGRQRPAREYHLLPSVLAGLLAPLGRHDEARAQWQRAADLTHNARERGLLLERADRALAEGGSP
jgi:predicted RNA polymerase sigma factor